MKIGILATFLLLATGEVVTPAVPMIGSAANLGALGVLAWVVWTQFGEIKSLRRTHGEIVDKLCERWDSWEKIRHEDSERLDKTLLAMARHVADAQHACKAKTGG